MVNFCAPSAALCSPSLLPLGKDSHYCERNYQLRDVENGIEVSYDQAGCRHSACFTVCNIDNVFHEPLSASSLARPGMVVLSLERSLTLGAAWGDLSTWCTSDVHVTFSAESLFVTSHSNLRNAVHAALALCAAGGALDRFEFTERKELGPPRGKPHEKDDSE